VAFALPNTIGVKASVLMEINSKIVELVRLQSSRMDRYEETSGAMLVHLGRILNRFADRN
jgi:hypothetical protein